MICAYNRALDISCVAVWVLYSVYFFWLGAKSNVMRDIIYETLRSMSLAELSNYSTLGALI
jgi:hypothetical protein